MDDFYKNIKKYGEFLPGKYVKYKPKPVDIDYSIEYGLYWISNSDYFKKIPKTSTVLMSLETFKILTSLNLIDDNINILLCKEVRKTYSNILYDLYPYLFKESKLKKLKNKNAFVGKNVTIGNNINMGNNVVIYDNVVIGDNVTIGDNVVIGSKGVAFDQQNDNKLIRFPQIGGVIIEDNVEIGSFCDIKRGALKNTIISNGVKMGAFNNIGHNVFIGENCFISMRCNVCGSSIIGKGSTLWVNSTIKHKIIIPEESIIGSNTYVDKNFDKIGIILLGIPAKEK